ncbi:hypothetical protein OG422_14675 [Streptomyces sp. NBC_01525]|uniref:hypothetical protein n=1 Tax=Streptomyces sp. NBC_01525 TaxID=2903893 RepID=UPI003866DB70
MRPERVAYWVRATARRPDGEEIPLGGWVSYSPGGAVAWMRRRAVQVAQQVGAPYDGTVRAWLADLVEQDGAREALTAGVGITVRAVDAYGCLYTVAARPERPAAGDRLRARRRQGAVAWSGV